MQVVILLCLTDVVPLVLAIDWPTNVVMASGVARLALLVPTDREPCSTENFTCLNAGIATTTTGSCDLVSVDQVGVVEECECMLSGSNGGVWSASGLTGTGWVSTAPPQTLASAKRETLVGR